MAAVTTADLDHSRRMMVQHQVRTWDVLDARVLDLLEAMPRERFVPDQYRDLSYADTELPLGDGQMMMSPKVEGRVLQALDIEPDDSVLEIGTGSGFLTACLAALGGEVSSCDNRETFLANARGGLDYVNLSQKVDLLHRDAANLSWIERRFDVICVTGSMPVLEPSFTERLEIGGRLFVVVGQPPVMEARLLTRVGENEWIHEDRFETVLAPLDNVLLPSSFAF